MGFRYILASPRILDASPGIGDRVSTEGPVPSRCSKASTTLPRLARRLQYCLEQTTVITRAEGPVGRMILTNTWSAYHQDRVKREREAKGLQVYRSSAWGLATSRWAMRETEVRVGQDLDPSNGKETDLEEASDATECESYGPDDGSDFSKIHIASHQVVYWP